MDQKFWNLQVVQKSFELTLGVYDLTDHFPVSERFRLIDQLCRASVSVPANIGEGEGRYSSRDQLKFLYIARGSLNETDVLLRIAEARKYGNAEDFHRLRSLDDDVGHLLNGLIRAKRSYA